ncbi:MAG TPA: hypothetical protein PKV92_09160 [Thermodesulfovibrio thiophilus]|nr:hypothetical protein [Thermodesulfovibrio thiophilus]
MKFQIKIIVSFSVVLALILFYINYMMVTYLDVNQNRLFSQSIDKTTEQEKIKLMDQIKEFLTEVLLWEFLLVLSLMFILYQVINRLTKHERDYKNLLELILLTVSHKFGNFITIQKGNIELLKITHDEKAINRLESSYNYFQEDFYRIVDTIKSFKNIGIQKEKINLKVIIEKHLELINTDKSIIKNLKDVYIYANKQNIDNIVFFLLENAFKYSDERIHIRLTKKMLAIRNDIAQTDKSSGIGLKITETFAKKEGFKIKYRAKEKNYIVTLILQ